MKASVIVTSAAALVLGFVLGLFVPWVGSDLRSESPQVAVAGPSERESSLESSESKREGSEPLRREGRSAASPDSQALSGFVEGSPLSQAGPSSPAVDPRLELQPTGDPEAQLRLAEEHWAAADELDNGSGEVPAEIEREMRGMADFVATADQADEAERWNQYKENASAEELASDAIQSLSAAGAPEEMIRHTQQLLLAPGDTEPAAPIDPRDLVNGSPRG